MSTLKVNNQFSTQSPHFRPSQAREQPPPGLNMSCRIKPQFMPRDIHCQVIEYKYVVNLHWGWVWEISAFSFLFRISIWTMHHQLAKRAVIVVIISVYPCLLRRNNQCLNQWSPPSIYFTTTKRCSIFDKKIWRGKASLQQDEIVTFAGNYNVSIYLPLTKLKITDFFLY